MKTGLEITLPESAREENGTFEIFDIPNPSAFKCDCGRTAEAGSVLSNGGNSVTGEVYWDFCKHCEDDSEAAYQNSLLDVDRRESELAEMDY